MKYLVIILICLSSCSTPRELPREINPEYPIPQPQEKVEPIQPIIYEIVEKKEEKVLTEETLRMLIAEFFSTIGTIIAIFTVADNQ